MAGGADRNRTDGLLSADQALSRLSYSPWERKTNRGRLDAGGGAWPLAMLERKTPSGESETEPVVAHRLGVERLPANFACRRL